MAAPASLHSDRQRPSASAAAKDTSGQDAASPTSGEDGDLESSAAHQRLPAPPQSPALTDSSPPPSRAEPESSHPPIIPESPKGTLLWRIRGMIRTVRPQQWVKNLFVLAPVVFAKHLTDPALIRSGIGAFAVFCLLAGAVYTLNDLVDAKADRLHPAKRYRPIASGRVPIAWARVLAVGLVVVALGGAAAILPVSFLAVAVGYFALNLAYSFGLKKIAYVDVGCIALGFVLRVLAGGFATATPISGFMVACTALLALFLGFGKRRHELAAAHVGKTRVALDAYSPTALTIALAVTGLATVGTYLAYTLDPATQAFFDSRLLWITAVHPLFGLIRFLQLVVGRPKAESPTQEILRDTPFVLNVVMWVAEVIAIVYRLRPS